MLATSTLLLAVLTAKVEVGTKATEFLRLPTLTISVIAKSGK